jgi:glutathionyl-hydroquinone reductase
MTTATPTFAERLVEMVPKTYRQEITRMVRQVRDRLPPVVIERRLAAIERRMEHGFREIEAKLDAMERKLGQKAA